MEARVAPVKMAPDGTASPNVLELVLERTLDARRGLVIEHVVSRARDDDEAPGSESTLVWRIGGDRFTCSERDGNLTGTGSLFGSPWKWDAWDLELDLRNERRITGHFQRVGDDLHAERTYVALDGRVLARMSEVYHAITRDEFVEARERMLGL